MLRSFPSITKRLMVGIGGGAPDVVDIRLGDIVVGEQVVQHDFGKTTPNGFQHTSVPLKAPPDMLKAVSKLIASHARGPSKITQMIDDMLLRYPRMSKFQRPQTPDLLFEHSYNHDSSVATCQACDRSKLVQRQDRPYPDPVVHYGTIASGNDVIKDGVTRSRLTRKFEAKCFEMEAAGLGENFPCLVIRGICDYSDSHKNKDWQEYAAAAAAAHAKELLLDMSTSSPLEITDDEEMQQKARRELIDSLAFDEMESRQTNIRKALNKTCEWFLKDPRYLDWLDPNMFQHHLGLLWISGKPGAGKSTIMKFAHRYTAEKWAGASDTAVISFFFNARGAGLEKCTEGMYRSLLYQVFQSFHDLQQVLARLGRKHTAQPKSSSISWTLEELESLFRKVIDSLGGRRLICFIDALDECDEDQIREMIGLFEEFGETAHQSHAEFLVCFASRHYPHIELQHGGLRLTLEDQPGHSLDVKTYVQNKLRAGQNTVSNQLKHTVLEKAAGVFLWVVLVVEILNKELQRGRITDAKRLLDGLPSKLHDLFKDLLTRESSNLDELLLCIQWILYATYPLTFTELYFAIHAGLTEDFTYPHQWDPEHEPEELMRRFILSSSKGLAEITGKMQTVQFIHESVRDFLIRDNGIHELWPERSDGFEVFSHGRLTTCCLTYTRLDSLASWHFRDVVEQGLKHSFFRSYQAAEVRVILSRKYPFLEYATKSLLYHANASKPTETERPFADSFNCEGWIYLRKLYDTMDISRQGNKCLIFARGNYVELLKECYRDKSTDVLEEGEVHPIFSAVVGGHHAAFRFLLDNTNATVNIKVPTGQKTLLILAVCQGHQHLVQDLLSQPGIDINAHDKMHMTALMHAVQLGYTSITKLLLSTEGIDINVVDEDGETAVLIAARKRDWPMMKELLKKGPVMDINHKDCQGQTVSSYAVASGSQDTIRLLLGMEGFDVHGKGKNTPLIQAVRQNRPGIVKQLVAAGANVNIGYPLIYATRLADLEIFQELLEAPGLNTNKRDGLGRTALSYAAEMGQEVMMGLLLNMRGLKKDSRDIHGRTPLWWAVDNCQTGAVRQLITAGAACDFSLNRGPASPFLQALHSTRPESTEVLLEIMRAPGFEVKQLLQTEWEPRLLMLLSCRRQERHR